MVFFVVTSESLQNMLNCRVIFSSVRYPHSLAKKGSDPSTSWNQGRMSDNVLYVMAKYKGKPIFLGR